MPQPLNRVVRNATFRHNPFVLDTKPIMAQLVARIFAHWGLIEYRLSLLLVRVLGADATPSLAMFSTLIAQHLQLRALEAAAQAALSTEEFRVFKAALAVAERVQTPRNELAHGIWGGCHELPDALLVADPKASKEQDKEFTLLLERSDKEGLDIAEAVKLNSYDPSKVNVYNEADLQRAERDLSGASDIVFLTVIYLDGMFRGRRRGPARSRMSRDQVFHQLYGQRLFREAWDQPKKG
jgi:hypothetical protein